ncbi:MAG TPA: hypothetical protein VG897_02585, partial [Terriglobales bacterium]|nr:hypothetical protein [Terriglobales bacterium]
RIAAVTMHSQGMRILASRLMANILSRRRLLYATALPSAKENAAGLPGETTSRSRVFKSSVTFDISPEAVYG